MENNNKNNNDLNSNDTPLSSKLMLNSTPFKEYQNYYQMKDGKV